MQDNAWRKKYHQAAIAYFVYGLIYWLGGYYLIEVGVSARGGTTWLLIGAAFVFLIPPLIWHGFKWFTRVLALLVLVRVGGLAREILTDEGRTVPSPLGSGEVPMVVGAVIFLIVAAVTAGLLLRAGFARRTPEPSAP